MAEATWDMIGSTGGIDRSGYTGSRVVMVDSLDTSIPGYARLADAIDFIDLPIGTPHPIYVDSALQSINGVHVSHDAVQLTLNYIPFLNVPVEIQVDGATVEKETNRDVNGDPIKVGYTYPANYPADPNRAGKTEEVGKTIKRRFPTSTIVIKERKLITGTELTDLTLAYEGAVNAAGWNLRPTAPAGTWLCASISSNYVGIYIDGPDVLTAYDITYAFEYDPEGWKTSVVFEDPETGNPPDPATWAEDTQKDIQVANIVNFSPLTVGVA